MITSDAGLYNLPHIPAPAGLDELRAGMVSVKLPVCELPITFIPGVKLVRDGRMLDIMRGEETEVVGILQRLALDTCTLILPGSHMKCVHVENGRIVDFTTSMTGELSRAAAEHTILSRSIGDAFPRDPDVDFLRRGRELLTESGSMNAALFRIRVTAMGDPAITQDQLYAMLLGIVLSDDVRRMKPGAPILVGGSNPFRAAYLTLLGDAGLQAEAISEDLAENAAAYGAWEICRPQS
jgi:2-dehydro-3-deoxygalactonokinase